MADILTRSDVERIAALARLELTEDETALFAAQLTAILAYADQVQRVDTTGVEPAALTASGPGGRNDDLEPSLDRDVVLEQAPASDRATGLFKVPRVLGS